MKTSRWLALCLALAAAGIMSAGFGIAGRVPELLSLTTAAAFSAAALLTTMGALLADRARRRQETIGVPRTALSESAQIVLLACHPSGRLRPLNLAGTRILKGGEGSGQPHLSWLFPEAEVSDLLAEVGTVLSSSHPLPARSRLIRDPAGHTREATVTLFPLPSSAGEVGLLLLETQGGPQRTEAGYRLLEGCPAGLLRIDGAGLIESVSGTFASWAGRAPGSFTGMKISTFEILPAPFREVLDRAARETGSQSDLQESSLDLLGADGKSRPLHAFFSRDAGGVLNVVLVDGASRGRLQKERDSAKEALAAARKGSSRSGPIPLVQTNPHVLLVEDNDENRDLLAHMLKTRGARVTACATGWQAVEAAQKETFDLVLLDLQLPVMDGYEVAHHLRALPGGSDLPVVALTAFTSERERERAQIEGFNDFVGKPVSLAVLGDLLRRWALRPGE